MNEQIKIAVKALYDIKTCFNCVHINVEENKCQKFGSQPPLKIIEKGCPQHETDIPF